MPSSKFFYRQVSEYSLAIFLRIPCHLIEEKHQVTIAKAFMNNSSTENGRASPFNSRYYSELEEELIRLINWRDYGTKSTASSGTCRRATSWKLRCIHCVCGGKFPSSGSVVCVTRWNSRVVGSVKPLSAAIFGL